jgi:hypothetical protein
LTSRRAVVPSDHLRDRDTAAGAHDQQLVLYDAASMFTSFLVGLLAIARRAPRERRHKSSS